MRSLEVNTVETLNNVVAGQVIESTSQSTAVSMIANSQAGTYGASGLAQATSGASQAAVAHQIARSAPVVIVEEAKNSVVNSITTSGARDFLDTASKAVIAAAGVTNAINTGSRAVRDLSEAYANLRVAEQNFRGRNRDNDQNDEDHEHNDQNDEDHEHNDQNDENHEHND